MSEIRIGGKTYNGNSVTIINGVVVVDGKRIDSLEKQINIEIVGNISELNVDYCEKITVRGNVGSIKNGSGDIECHNVENDVQSQSGNVECKSVSGNVTTQSGDVNCRGSIGGNANTTSGDIEADIINGGAKTVSGKIIY